MRRHKKSPNKTSKYKHVSACNPSDSNFCSITKGRKWVGQILWGMGIWVAYFETEREAAIAVDKKLIEIGEEPVNILKRKL